MISEFQKATSNPPLAGDIQAKLTILKFIHVALVSGVVMFGGVILLMAHNKISLMPDFQDPFNLVACGVAVVTIVLATSLQNFFFVLNPLPKEMPAALAQYSVFVFIRAAIVESGAMVALVVTFVKPNILPFILAALCAAVLAILRPSQEELQRLMKRSPF